MYSLVTKRARSFRRAHRTRAKVRGTEHRPRLSVFRSSRHIFAQVIDDVKGVTLVSASDLALESGKIKLKLRERASLVGEAVAAKAKAAKINAVRFDRGHARYHGIVAALAEGARKGGLKL